MLHMHGKRRGRVIPRLHDQVARCIAQMHGCQRFLNVADHLDFLGQVTQHTSNIDDTVIADGLNIAQRAWLQYEEFAPPFSQCMIGVVNEFHRGVPDHGEGLLAVVSCDNNAAALHNATNRVETEHVDILIPDGDPDRTSGIRQDDVASVWVR